MHAPPPALTALTQAHSAALTAWVESLTSGPSDSAQGDTRAMSDDGLVLCLDALSALARRVAQLQARLAAEVAERSSTDAAQSLAAQRGFSSPARLIAQSIGEGFAMASRLVAVGTATATRESLSGEQRPARYPFVATALDEGTVSVAAAAAITSFLDGIRLRADAHDLADAERLLVDRAPLVGADGITRLVKNLTAHLDPVGVKLREDELRDGRSLRLWEDRRGFIRLAGTFDPVNGAHLKTAVDALVGAELHRERDERRTSTSSSPDGGASDTAPADPIVTEARTIVQMNADALTDIARLALGSSASPPSLRSATVVARIELDDLLATGDLSNRALRSGDGSAVSSDAPEGSIADAGSRRGSGPGSGSSDVSNSGRSQGWATLDGVDQPISAASVRELASSAGITSMILGSRGEVLDLGRSERYFSTAQRLALAERDGGCAFPGCTRPPQYTHAHHIDWWTRDRGRTDLDNGILLCSFHHHRVHDDGWTIRVRDGRSWFIPPAHLDPDRVPRPGNRGPGLTRRRSRSASLSSLFGVPPPSPLATREVSRQ